jgi:hypothetical protein
VAIYPPLVFGGKLPTPADPMSTTGYKGRRITGGYESPTYVTGGYGTRRVTSGYDQPTSTAPYGWRRKTKGYAPT